MKINGGEGENYSSINSYSFITVGQVGLKSDLPGNCIICYSVYQLVFKKMPQTILVNFTFFSRSYKYV